jgi:hypothetical protein
MNIRFEVKIHVGISEFANDGNNYYAASRTKKFDDEKKAVKFLTDLRIQLGNTDQLFDFLQENFGYEEFDICNVRILGLFKITEEELWTPNCSV